MTTSWQLKRIGTGRVTIPHESKYERVERERRFLLRELPPGLKTSDPHAQVTDNYITNTRLRLRKKRWPATNEWTLKLTQKYPPDPEDFSRTLITSIYLTEEEYEVLSVFEGNEIRKNRYRYEHEGRTFGIDMFLGSLFGLILAETSFETDEEMAAFTQPPFAFMDVTNDPLFTGGNLVNLSFDDLRVEMEKRLKED